MFRTAVQVLQQNDQRVLRTLYISMTCLSLFMVSWILFIPGTTLMGFSESHRARVEEALVNSQYNVTPPEIVMKYQGHTLVHFTHFIPGAFWAASLPLQFHPRIRKEYRALHRISGYLFVFAVMLMTFGIALIMHRGLLFENFYPEIPKEAYHQTEIALGALSLWFMFTPVMALIQARARNFAEHQKWMLRHVGSGLWISLQRLILVLLGPCGWSPPTRKDQRDMFGFAAQIATVVTVCGCELAVYLLNQQRQRSKKSV